jgi:hypothetical protein
LSTARHRVGMRINPARIRCFMANLAFMTATKTIPDYL